MTIKHSRGFDTPLGRFSYLSCGIDYFPIGIRQEQENSDTYLIATPEKALCDLVLKTSGVNTTSVKSIRTYLESDLRFEMEALREFDIEILEQCRQHAKMKNETFTHLINLISDERHF